MMKGRGKAAKLMEDFFKGQDEEKRKQMCLVLNWHLTCTRKLYLLLLIKSSHEIVSSLRNVISTYKSKEKHTCLAAILCFHTFLLSTIRHGKCIHRPAHPIHFLLLYLHTSAQPSVRFCTNSVIQIGKYLIIRLPLCLDPARALRI
ncbi:hypothetical protein HAX54_020849 [Datura stramonium]|uniref:Uncharacterized protein n=1 Tax=Datura stramonium TaxID=4076 RepID=A0ABS8UU17_DATST|nr:hypothetical protein [Datura stramonium]